MKSELLGTKAFVTIAELGSFTHAAETLNITQPALTRRIRKLEESLQVPLFERTTRKVTLTRAGKLLLPNARTLLDFMDNAILSVQELAVHQKSVIRLSCIPTATFYFLPEVIKNFNATYPNIRLYIDEQATADSLDSVLNGEVDFGINMNNVANPDITFTPLVNEPFILVCQPDHPLSQKHLIEWRELKPYKLIGVRRSSGNRRLIEQEIAKHGESLEWFYEVRHFSTALGFAESGLGITVLPCLAMPRHEHPSLVAIPLVEPVIRRTIGIIQRNNVPLSPVADRFFSHLLEMWNNHEPDEWSERFSLLMHPGVS